MSTKLFDYIIGNPPYNDDFENSGENGNFAKPVYNYFMDATYEISDKVELVHPARFLFNAGSTPKAWNNKMLNDNHLKVLYYEPDAEKVFAGKDIKGGIAVTYRDETKDFGAIGIFTAYDELNTILHKVTETSGFSSFSTIVVNAYSYRFTDKLHKDNPEAIAVLSSGHAYDLKSNVFVKLPNIFLDSKPDDGNNYVKVYGLDKVSRTFKWIRSDYIIDTVVNFKNYKVFMPAASGAGTFGEVLTSPFVAEPFVGSTETFISIGNFATEYEANNCLKYIKAKFVRALFGVLKVSQHVTPDKWKYVPMQDFTEESDIDWSKSVHEVDLQLYRKYGLDVSEIEFIESHVKEME